jgi:hypothetical protein
LALNQEKDLSQQNNVKNKKFINNLQRFLLGCPTSIIADAARCRMGVPVAKREAIETWVSVPLTNAEFR